MTETVSTSSTTSRNDIDKNNTEIPSLLEKLVACVKSGLGLDTIYRRLDAILDSSPRIDKFHLGCHIASILGSYCHQPDLQDRLSYIKILLWICGGNSPISNRSPFAAILRREVESALMKYEPLLDTQDYDFLQTLLQTFHTQESYDSSEDFEIPEYLISPIIPLTSQQAKEAKYWSVPKATTNVADTSTLLPLHFLEPPFFRPSPLINHYLFPFLTSGVMLDGASESDTANTTTNSKAATEATTNTSKSIITKVEELSATAQDIMRSEFIWLNPQYPFLQFQRFQLDEDDSLAGDDTNKKKSAAYLDESVTALFDTKAYVSTLLPHEEQTVLKAIRGISNTAADNDSSTIKFFSKSQFLQECKLEPQTLPLLVENNHNIAIECLLKILSPPGEDIDDSFGPEQENDFLSALVSMDMSLQSMEVVNFLATTPWSIYNASTTVEKVGDERKSGRESKQPSAPLIDSSSQNMDRYLLPKEFLHSFISNCISCCENIVEEKLQKRSVRLCCIFFQNLIQRNIVDVEEVQVEVQAFCIEFSRFREAIVLFKLLKDSEVGND
jgi:hypothetical protein